jgi:hypothetical protein
MKEKVAILKGSGSLTGTKKTNRSVADARGGFVPKAQAA